MIGLIGMFVVSLQSLYYQAELNKIWAHLGSPQEGETVTLPGPAVPAAGQ